MDSNLIAIVSRPIIVGLSLVAGISSAVNDYNARLGSSKGIDQLPALAIPPELYTLVARFNSSVAFRVSDDVDGIPQVAILYRHPPYIIISKYVLGQTIDDDKQFYLKHLLALVAHELGHIERAGISPWLLGLCTSGMMGAWLYFFLNLTTADWASLLWSVIAFVPFLVMFNIVSQIDEFRADSFVVKDASIPVVDFADALVALEIHAARKSAKSMDPARLIMRFLSGILRKTHPSTKRRIRRLQKLFG